MEKIKIKIFYVIEFFLVFTLFFIFLFSEYVFAGIGVNNITVLTNLTVGTSYPIISRIDVEGGSIVLIPGSEKKVNCTVYLEDYDGEGDIRNVTAIFFNTLEANQNSPDDNNNHYTNESCFIDTSYGNEYQALAHCVFDVWYYANPGEWNCSVSVVDYFNYQNNLSNSSQIQPLLALGLPDIIQYGTVNATYVSDENITNITNLGNVKVNLSLSGYGFRENDGNAMNCTFGSIKNISIFHEKYNLTQSTPGELSLTQFQTNYINLTSNPIVKKYNLDFRHDDLINEAWNYTYWRVYVPIGVAGTCQGNIIFGAVQANEV